MGLIFIFMLFCSYLFENQIIYCIFGAEIRENGEIEGMAECETLIKM